MDLKKQFIGHFGAGVAIIFICSYFGQNLLPLILTIAVMLLYYYTGTKALNSKKSISYEQFADSNYYMGFLFTLVSLSITLMNLAVDDKNISTLISQFGIAILTTLVGLFIRIYVINFIPTEEANRETLDRIVAEKMQMIDEQITQTIDRNKMFSDVLDEKINMFQEKTESNLNSFVENLLKNLDITKLSEIVNNISTEMNQTYKKQSEVLENLVKEIGEVNKNYVNNVENVNSNIKHNYEFLNNFVESIEIVKNKLEEYTSNINITSSKYDENVKLLNTNIEKSIETISTKNDLNNKLALENFKNILSVNKNLAKTITDESTKNNITINSELKQMVETLGNIKLNEDDKINIFLDIQKELSKIQDKLNIEKIDYTSVIKKLEQTIDEIKPNQSTLIVKQISTSLEIVKKLISEK